MNNQTYQKQVIEINIKELIWDLLAQWKAVLLVSLIMALLMCGARYAKDKSAFDASIIAQKEAEAQKALSKTERIAAVVDALPADKREAVWLIIQEKEWVDAQRDYLRESILMRTDPTNQRVLSMVFKIDAENEEDLPVLAQAYASLAFSENTEEVLGTLIDPAANKKYIGELIRGSGDYTDSEANEMITASGPAITIRMILPEEANADDIAKAIAESLSEQGKKLKAKSPHSIGLADYEEIRIYDRKTVKDRKNTFDSINSLETMIKTERNSLSVEQDAAVAAILKIIDEQDSVEELASAAEQETQPAAVAPAPGPNVKYAIMGFILGMLIYALCYVVIVILRGTVNTASGIEGYTNSRLLGAAYYKGERAGLAKLLHSNLIDKLRYKNLPAFDSQIDRIGKSVAAVCTHADAKDVAIIKLTDTETAKPLNDAIKSVADSIGNSGVNSNEIDTLDSFEENDLLKINNAVMVVGNDTKVSHLGNIAALCRDYDINMLGSIYLSEM